MMACGHTVRLYSYGEVTNIPNGVEFRDAETILPRSKLLRHKKSGSYSLGSNIFRYELIQKEETIWLDADVYCLKPLKGVGPIVLGWESDSVINGAVLGLPSDHIMLQKLKKYYDARVFLPPWWSLRRKINNILRSFIGIDKKAERVGWGVLGPKAITYFAKSTKITEFAHDPEVFYPIPLDNIGEIFDPNENPERYVSDRTITVHLWNEMIKHRKQELPAQGSYMHRLCLEQGLDLPDIQEMINL
ncbi:hypothetical protein [Pseudovibrio sp. W64]|uniref:hypothetical protein n=1 Tax=Pseudovibrio sp. W64 TaxID=1735583 RepID=UPI001FCBD16B|nr:hypothetical protein [Pseudovibrio sp. W64]